MSKMSRLAYVVAAAVLGSERAVTSTALASNHIAIFRFSSSLQVYPTSVYNDAGVKAVQQRRKALINQHVLNRVKKAKNASKHLKGKAVTYKLR